MDMNWKRLTCWLLMLAVCISLLPGITLPAKAVMTEDDYLVTNDGYIYNWGTQGEVATFLSPHAQAYYQENNITYASLAALSGGTTQSNAPNSALYKALQKLMTDTHTSYTNYEDTKKLYAYTDAQNNVFGKLYCVYCVGEMTSAWNSGNIWQREHTWPKSKSLNGNSAFEEYGYNDETDIMMLRACHAQENKDRSNIAYGKSSGYYYPNLASADVRGDVARTMLYGYVRWGNTQYMWGSSGVIESLAVLLEWMEADPVDTWEMGRNDSVEAINGNRNVFIDYPELAFLMFGKQIPEGMSTPSGSSQCEHEDSSFVEAQAPTCTQKGNTAGYFCNDCKRYYDGYTKLDALGHQWQEQVCTGGRVCTVCGVQEEGGTLSIVTTPTAGTAYKLGIDKKDGVIRYFNGSTESSSVNYRLAATTNVDSAVDVYLESASGGYRLYFMNGSAKTYIRMYQYKSGSDGKGTGSLALVTAAPSETMTFDTTAKTLVYQYNSSNSYYMGTYGTYTTFSASNTSYITGSNATNVDVSQFPARLYQVSAGTGHSWQDATCTTPKTCTVCGTTEGGTVGHSWSNWEQTQAPSCTADGEKHRLCTICGTEETEVISTPGHSYEKYLCTVCGDYAEQALVEAIDLSADGKVTAFDAQLLAEAKAGVRQLTEAQWTALGELQVADIINYLLGRYGTAE